MQANTQETESQESQAQNEETKETVQILANSKITTYDNKELTKTKTAKIDKEIDGIINYQLKEAESEIGKGKIYTGESRDYTVTAIANVNSIEANKNIEFKLEKANYIAETGEKTANIEYKQISINREDFTKILGEDGYIIVKDGLGNTLANITNQTPVTEDGKIIATINAGTKEITVTTSKPISTGKIEFVTTKSIIESNYTRKEIKGFSAIEDKINSNSETAKAIVNLKETSTMADLKVSTSTLTTEKTNENVQIKVTLLTNGEDKDLYKNPCIKLTFPKEVTEISAKHKILYGNGLELESSKIKEENGQKVLEVQLKGEQTSYQGDAIEGTVLMVSADLTLDKLATSGKEKITLSYTNENAISYADKAENDELVAQGNIMPLAIEAQTEEKEEDKEGTIEYSVDVLQTNPFIVTNDVKEYNISTIGQEEDKKVEIETNSGTKQATIDIGLVNNEGEEVQNVKILGKFPTKNTTNTADITLKSGITVTSDTPSAKIYYTSNETATDDLTNEANGWKENSDLEGAAKYLIVLDKMANGENFKASYVANIATNPEENATATEAFEVKYTKKNNEEKTAKSTNVVFSIVKVGVLEMSLSATVGADTLKDGDEVKAGEVIKYTVTLKNNEAKDISGMTVTGGVPEGTCLYETQDADTEYKVNNDTKKVFENISIKKGETVDLSYQVKVNSDIEDLSSIVEIISTDYNNTTTKITNVARTADIVLEMMTFGKRGKNTVKSGYNYIYVLNIRNISNEDKKNVVINLYNNELLNIDTGYADFIKDDKTITIDEIKAGENYWIRIAADVLDINGPNQFTNIYAIAKGGENNYRSNIIVEEIENISGTMELTSSILTNNNNKVVKEGDNIVYTIKLKNTGTYKVDNLIIKDKISNLLQIEKVTLNDQEVIYQMRNEYEDDYSDLIVEYSLEAKDTVEIVIKTKVKKNGEKETIAITNQAKAYDEINYICETSEEVYYVKPSESKDNSNDNTNNQEDNKISFKINGKVWVDENEDGSSSLSERGLSGIRVMIIDANTGKVAVDSEEKELLSYTNADGSYSLENVVLGKYIVIFEYDTGKYIPTTYQKEGVSIINNSDAILKNIIINGKEKKLAVTNVLDINSDMLNIDLGLIEMKKFDLELNKYVSKIVTTNNKETKTYEFNNSKLAKAEIPSKQLNGTKVVVEYTIEIKNVGELTGYVKNIVDYKPQGLEFSSSLNSDWYQQGDYLYNKSLENEQLNAGETKEVKLILTKTMTESNTGLISNTAEIAEASNNLGISDNDSTPANRKDGEDDISKADVIISVKTGTIVSYIILIFSMLAIAGGGIYIIKQKLLKKV